MYAVSYRHTMQSSQPKFREPEVVRDLVKIRRERAEQRKAEQEAALEARKAHIDELIDEARAARIAIMEGKAAKADPEVAEILARLVPQTTFQRIERRAMRVFKVKLVHLRGSGRQSELAIARQFVCYWACRLTGLSLPQIGRLLGGRDHTTVLHSARIYPIKRARQGRTLRKAR